MSPGKTKAYTDQAATKAESETRKAEEEEPDVSYRKK